MQDPPEHGVRHGGQDSNWRWIRGGPQLLSPLGPGGGGQPGGGAQVQLLQDFLAPVEHNVDSYMAN